MRLKLFSHIFIILAITNVLTSCVSQVNDDSNMISASFLVDEYIQISEAYKDIEKYEEALTLLLKAESLSTQTNTLSFEIAHTAALAQRWELSLEYYNFLLSQDLDNVLLQKSIAWIYAQSGEIALANSMFETLYSQYYYDKEVCSNYILVLIASDNTEKAKEVLDAYSELYPEEENLNQLLDLIKNAEEESLHTESLSENENSSEEL